jgi:signal transduction histidine kinase
MNELVTHLSLPQELHVLNSDLELAAFRIIQEALNNVAKHARAENVWVTLDVTGSQYFSLSIQDDGIGFQYHDSFDVQHSEHIGLQQMKTRVSAMHDIFKLSSKPNEGSTIIVQMPGNNH